MFYEKIRLELLAGRSGSGKDSSLYSFKGALSSVSVRKVSAVMTQYESVGLAADMFIWKREPIYASIHIRARRQVP